MFSLTTAVTLVQLATALRAWLDIVCHPTLRMRSKRNMTYCALARTRTHQHDNKNYAYYMHERSAAGHREVLEIPNAS